MVGCCRRTTSPLIRSSTKAALEGKKRQVWHRREIKNEQTYEGKEKRQSYAEVVAIEQRNNKGKVIIKEQAEESMKVDRDWSKVLICTREKMWDNWKEIQNSLNKLYKKKFLLKPFQPDKAAFCCSNREEAEVFARKRILFIERPFTVRLQGWYHEDASLN